MFLALQLPTPDLATLAEWGKHALRDCRPIAADDLHVTLAFLGSQPRSELPRILDALAGAARASRPIAFEVARWRETRSVGMLVLDDRDGAAGALARDLHARLERLGVYRREQRLWLAHVTMCRFRVAPGLRPTLPEMGTCVPSDAAAYLSRLHPSGARYEVIATVGLGIDGDDMNVEERRNDESR